eukprot:1330-Amphidinium_carterae.1
MVTNTSACRDGVTSAIVLTTNSKTQERQTSITQSESPMRTRLECLFSLLITLGTLSYRNDW